jgi:uncharacterized protein YcfJ
MRKVVFALAMTAALAGCTTTERDVGTGAAIGAVAGGLISGDVGGALVGAGVGAAAGAFVRYAVRDGWCVYRNSRGRMYEAPCRR